MPLKKIFLFCFNRTWILYVIFFSVLASLVDVQAMLMFTKVRTLNRLRPPMTYLVDFYEGEKPFDKRKIDEYRHYYHKVTEYVSEFPDALGLEGYCLYQLSQPKKAIRSYKKALEGNKRFFWFYHNLGVISFHQEDYDKAIFYMSEALKQPFEIAVLYIERSRRLYLPLLAEKTNNYGPYLVSEFQDGQRSAFKVLALSFYQKAAFQELLLVSQQAIGNGLEENGFFHMFRGIALFHSGHYSEALGSLQEGFKMGSRDILVYNYIKRAITQMESSQRADIFLKQLAGQFTPLDQPSQILEGKDLKLFLY